MADSTEESNGESPSALKDYVSSPDYNEGGGCRRMSWSRALTRCVLIFMALIFYFWVVVVFITKMVIPASFNPLFKQKSANVSDAEGEDVTTYLVGAIFKNGLLMAMFPLQHTVMANCTSSIRECLERYDMAAFGRMIYVMATCCVMEVMYVLWTPLPYFTLWHIPSPIPLILLLALVHALCWCSIVSSLFMLDYLELLGLKQLYFYYMDRHGDPMSYKSSEQRQLYRHMRHPVFLAPLVILWACPVMTYDRVLLGVMAPLYLLINSRISGEDVEYMKEQYIVKKRELLSKKD